MVLKVQHIAVLKEFLEEPELTDIHSYTGYNDGGILRLRTKCENLLGKVWEFCELNQIEISQKFNHNLANYEIFVVAPDDVYQLKPKEY